MLNLNKTVTPEIEDLKPLFCFINKKYLGGNDCNYFFSIVLLLITGIVLHSRKKIIYNTFFWVIMKKFHRIIQNF